MPRIILNVNDVQKAERLLALFSDLDYVDASVDINEKVWTGHLPVLDNPVYAEEFKMYKREELHER